MKQGLLLLVCAVIVTAQCRADLLMAQEQNMAMEQKVRNMQAETKKVVAENQTLAQRNKQLFANDSVYKARIAKDVELINSHVVEITTLRDSVAKLTLLSNTSVIEPKSVALFHYPLFAKLTDKKRHSDQHMQVNMQFTNLGTESITKFTAMLSFWMNGQQLSDVLVEVVRQMGTNESVLWSAAIPFKSTDVKQMNLLNAPVGSIDLNVEVLSVTNTSGIVRKYVQN